MGTSEAETRAEAAAVKVAAGLSRLRGQVGEESNGEPIASNGDGTGGGKGGEEQSGS